LYRQLERRLGQHIREFVHRQYGLDLEKIVIEQPPKVEFGEYALPLAFELAKKLRKETGDCRYRARAEDEQGNLRTLIYISCTRPLCTP